MMVCQGCGAVAPDLSNLPREAAEIVESEAYLDLFARLRLAPAPAQAGVFAG